jgi:site-specific DNA-methyltransferase (adenine-specific)
MNLNKKSMANIKLINADCLVELKKYNDNYFDFAIVDPPYGINVDNNKKDNLVMSKHKSKNWDKYPPTQEYWKELFRVSKNQIVWGGNYFPLPLKKGWICWDKLNPLKGKFSDFELAWTSFLNCDRIYKQEWIGFGRKFREKESSIHPTQKPIDLYRWIIDNFTNEGDKILDTHLGSGSIAIACHYLNRNLMAYEIDKDYYEKACKRYKLKTMQQTMFKT